MSNQQTIFPCLRGVMGDWVYYSTLLTAEQVSKRISTAKSIREAESLDDYLQRDLTKNVKKICSYLLNHDSRMFNSMVIGVFDAVPDWLAFDLTQNEKLKSFTDVEKNALGESIGLLLFNGDEKMFAIDGQHRAQAIKCSFESNKTLINDDQYPVILVAHKDDEPGKKRSRKLFADINKKAVKVSKGDLVIIDEEEPSSIVARRVYSNSPNFLGGNLIALTNTANLNQDDTVHFSNLIILDQIVKILKPLHSHPRKKTWEDDDLEELYDIVNDFLDFVVNNINEYKSYFVTQDYDYVANRYENPNLLFRPIGQSLLAKIYKFFRLNNELEYLASHINNVDFSLPGKHYDRVAWNNGRMETKYQTVIYKLTLYLLNRLQEEDFVGEGGLQEQFEVATKNSISMPAKVV